GALLCFSIAWVAMARLAWFTLDMRVPSFPDRMHYLVRSRLLASCWTGAPLRVSRSHDSRCSAPRGAYGTVHLHFVRVQYSADLFMFSMCTNYGLGGKGTGRKGRVIEGCAIIGKNHVA
ncbi:unnamed protein product, partial [Ectocarpus sp. 12 AP-2014]